MQPYSLGITAIYLLTGKQPQEIEIYFRTGKFVLRQHALTDKLLVEQASLPALAYSIKAEKNILYNRI